MNAIVLDKTGTLTEGKPAVTNEVVFDAVTNSKCYHISLTSTGIIPSPIQGLILSHHPYRGLCCRIAHTGAYFIPSPI
jgi:hypothetical protein